MAITINAANRHESTRLTDVMEENVLKNIPSRNSTSGIRQVHADTGYNTEMIRSCLRARMMGACILRRRTKKKSSKSHNGKGRCNVVRYTVERFFSWPNNGFHRIRIRYERRSENYLAFANITSFMMYFRVLG